MKKTKAEKTINQLKTDQIVTWKFCIVLCIVLPKFTLSFNWSEKLLLLLYYTWYIEFKCLEQCWVIVCCYTVPLREDGSTSRQTCLQFLHCYVSILSWEQRYLGVRDCNLVPWCSCTTFYVFTASRACSKKYSILC